MLLIYLDTLSETGELQKFFFSIHGASGEAIEGTLSERKKDDLMTDKS